MRVLSKIIEAKYWRIDQVTFPEYTNLKDTKPLQVFERLSSTNLT